MKSLYINHPMGVFDTPFPGSDITSTYDSQMQESELDILRFAFARVMTAEEIIGI